MRRTYTSGFVRFKVQQNCNTAFLKNRVKTAFHSRRFYKLDSQYTRKHSDTATSSPIQDHLSNLQIQDKGSVANSGMEIKYMVDNSLYHHNQSTSRKDSNISIETDKMVGSSQEQQMDILYSRSGRLSLPQVQSLVLDSSLAPKTIQMYKKLYEEFELYCTKELTVPNEATEQQVLNWITQIYITKGYAVVPAFSALKHEFLRRGWLSTVLHSQRLKLFVQKFDLVYKKHFQQTRRRDAFAVEVLMVYFEKALLSAPTTFQHYFNLLVIMLAMRLILRPGELGLLLVGSVKFGHTKATKEEMMYIETGRLKSGKHIERQKSNVPVEQSHGRMCPVKFLKEYMNLLEIECKERGFEYSKEVPLFPIFKQNKIRAINRSDIDKLLQSIQQSIAPISPDLAELKLTPHSLRIGSATVLSSLGIPTDVIKALAVWSETSQVYMRYIRTTAAVKLKVSNKLFA